MTVGGEEAVRQLVMMLVVDVEVRHVHSIKWHGNVFLSLESPMTRNM